MLIFLYLEAVMIIPWLRPRLYSSFWPLPWKWTTTGAVTSFWFFSKMYLGSYAYRVYG